MGIITEAFLNEMVKLAAKSPISLAVREAHNPTLARYLPNLRARISAAKRGGRPLLGVTRSRITGGAHNAGYVHNVGN